MRAILYAILALVGSGALISPVLAAAASVRSEVSIPNSRSIRFTSHLNGRDYLVSVAVPMVPPPREGYPVFYLLDSYWMLGTAVDAARLSHPGVMVVGIGYPLDDAAFLARATRGIETDGLRALGEAPPRMRAIYALRSHDLSLRMTPAIARIGSLAEMADSMSRLSGGADSFLDVLEKEVKPIVAKVAQVDRRRQALFGHSLGGLTVLHAFLTHPDRYQSFIAASPSIWAAPALWDEATAFPRRAKDGAPGSHILLTAGEKEQEGLIAPAKMVDNMQAMAKRLHGLETAGAPIDVDDVVFADEDHGSVQQAAVSRALVFAFRRSKNPSGR